MKPHNLFKAVFIIINVCFLTGLSGQVKIGNNSSTVDPSAVLELEKTDQGLLITRIALTDATDITTIANPANSLLIYNTATAGSGTDIVFPGFYYWNSEASRWMGLVASTRPSLGVWVDAQDNILSNNSADQTLPGSNNVALGKETLGDNNEPSTNIIAIGSGACHSDSTSGDAYVVAIGKNTAYNNSGPYLNALGLESAMNNKGTSVNTIGTYAGYSNIGSDANAMGLEAAYSKRGDRSFRSFYGTIAIALKMQSLPDSALPSYGG